MTTVTQLLPVETVQVIRRTAPIRVITNGQGPAGQPGGGRGTPYTRAELDALAGASGLVAGQWYYIEDEGRVAYGRSASVYQAFPRITVSASPPSGAVENDLWVDLS